MQIKEQIYGVYDHKLKQLIETGTYAYCEKLIKMRIKGGIAHLELVKIYLQYNIEDKNG
jgi:hypothetical protein